MDWQSFWIGFFVAAPVFSSVGCVLMALVVSGRMEDLRREIAELRDA